MVQDAIMIAWSHRATLRDTNHFSAWISRILTNRCKNVLRRKKVLSFFPIDEDSVVTDEVTYKTPVQEAVEGLKPELRLLVTLCYYDGYTMKEIAELLSIPLGTVQTRLMRARRQLREKLSVEWEGEE